MKTSSAAPPIVLDESKVKAWRAANTFVLPGIGSIMAGRRAGYSQAILATGGFCLSNIWLFSAAIHFLTTGEIGEDILKQLLFALGGIGLFLAAWTWAQFTNRALLRDLRNQRKEEPN
jgi:hypothetical protein